MDSWVVFESGRAFRVCRGPKDLFVPRVHEPRQLCSGNCCLSIVRFSHFSPLLSIVILCCYQHTKAAGRAPSISNLQRPWKDESRVLLRTCIAQVGERGPLRKGLLHDDGGAYRAVSSLAVLFSCSSFFSQKVKLHVFESWVVELLFQINLSNLFLLVARIITFIKKLCVGPSSYINLMYFIFHVLIA